MTLFEEVRIFDRGVESVAFQSRSLSRIAVQGLRRTLRAASHRFRPWSNLTPQERANLRASLISPPIYTASLGGHAR